MRSDSRHQALFSGEILPGDRGLLFLIFFQGEITGKELDTETGYYYFGARYLDPKTSRWISADPAMGDYIPSAPVNDEAKKRNGNLPGQGGVFNYVNLHVYHYAGNNPIKYVDPDGRDLKSTLKSLTQTAASVGQAIGNTAVKAGQVIGNTAASAGKAVANIDLNKVFPQGVPIMSTTGVVVSPNAQQRDAEAKGTLIGAAALVGAVGVSVAAPVVAQAASTVVAAAGDKALIGTITAINLFENTSAGNKTFSEVADIFIGGVIGATNALLGTNFESNTPTQKASEIGFYILVRKNTDM